MFISVLNISILQIWQKVISFIELEKSFPILVATFDMKSRKSVESLFSVSDLSIEPLHRILNFSLLVLLKNISPRTYMFFHFQIFFDLFPGLMLKINWKNFIALLSFTISQLL